MWHYCSKCNKFKPLWDMETDKTRFLGIRWRCKKCGYIRNAKWRREHPTYAFEWQRKNRIKLRSNAKIRRQSNPEKEKRYKQTYHKKHPKRVKKLKKKWNASDAFYDTHAFKLTPDIDAPRKGNNGKLLVRCTYCGRYIVPTNLQVRMRVNAILGKGSGEARFYCSDKCKKACPIFGQRKHYKGQSDRANTREVNPELRQMALERDHYTCQSCGVTLDDKPLAVHHIVPVKADPTYEADLDNVITLCRGHGSCHGEAHKKGWCKTGQLARLCA